MEEELIAWGHENILSTHSSTIEITRDFDISRRANCVIGVGANKGLVDLSPEFKKLARSSSTEIVIIFESGGKSETVHAKGDSRLTFSHAHETVIRKSSYVCPRTLAVFANKAATDLNRALIQQLQVKGAKLDIKIIARRCK